MTERTIRTRVGALHVTTSGEQGPTALLWHSLFVDERSWSPMLPHLDGARRLVVVTGPGHGASTDPGRRYDLRHCADAAVEILDELGIREPIDWIGNAWGGHVGIHFAAEHPHRCRSVIAFGSPIAALNREEKRTTRLLLGVYRLLGPTTTIIDGVTDALLSPHTIDHDPHAVELVHDCLRRADRRMLGNAVVSISLRRPDLSDRLANIASPVLIVTGSDHQGFTAEQAEAAVRMLPRGRLAIVPASAYLVPLEAPDTAAGLALEFWAEAGVTR
ncbi:alpha/beta fold hydrolase [Agromyces sp. M3QZ16-3]|uniref:alpha/beta fold hydrolase n=1 Tax=Agromyces sp. M3QZ16-3 TaxID=3447585 RepID=UPI003F68DADC